MTETLSEYGAAGARWERPSLEEYKLRNEVHVWRVSLAAGSQPLGPAGDSLSDEEQVRAARLRRPGDRDRYVAAHSALRIILGRYLNRPPEEIRYVANPHGKPGLAPGLGSGQLRFNLAHSGDLALVAVAAGREVGVDVEHCRALPEVESIAQRYFSVEERETLATLPDWQRREAFFNIWACKEAFIKATGLGLSYPLQSFSAPLVAPAGQRPAQVETGASTLSGAGQAWGLRRLSVSTGYAAAVAAEELSWALRLWQY